MQDSSETKPEPTRSSHSFKSLLVRAIILPSLLLFVLALALLWQLARLNTASQWVLHTDNVVDQARQLQVALLDMETGMRGYLLTGRSEFLQPYNAAKPKLNPALAHIEQLASTKPEQISRVQKLKLAIAQWTAHADRGVTSRNQGRTSNKLAQINEGVGKVMMDDLRLQIDEFVSAEHQIQETRTKDFESVQRGLVVLILGATFLFATILVYFGRRQLRALSSMYEKTHEASEKASGEVVEILEGMNDGFLETDASWNIIRVNRVQEQVSQLPRENTVGRNFWDVFPELAKKSSKFWIESHRAMDGRETVEFEDYYAHLGLDIARAIYPRKGGGIAIFFRDVTETKAARQALDDQVRELQREKAIREIFVSTLSHDLRNPLGVVQMSSEILRDEPDDTPENRDLLVKMIFNAAQRANRMIENLLDANRLKAGERLPLKIEVQDLFSIAQEIIGDLRLVYKNDVELICYESKLLGHWSADAVRRMLENLVTNAIKYGTKDSVITVSIRATGGHVEFRVHNIGNPVSSNEQVKLFDPFQRSKSAQASGQHGWGLGLTLVRGLAEAHGGNIRVESSASEGTTFIVCLPRDVRPQAEDENAPAPPCSFERECASGLAGIDSLKCRSF